MKIWQFIGAVACIGIWLVIATANIEALVSLGSDTAYITVGGVELTTKTAMATLAIVIDIMLIVSGFAAAYWWARGQEMTAAAAIVVWIICAGVSLHSTKVWLDRNIAMSAVPAQQSQDVYDSLKAELGTTTEKLDWLMSRKLSNMARSERQEVRDQIERAEARITELRSQLATTNVTVASSPIEGFQLYIAVGLLVLNALSWLVVFGGKNQPQTRQRVEPAVNASISPEEMMILFSKINALSNGADLARIEHKEVAQIATKDVAEEVAQKVAPEPDLEEPNGPIKETSAGHKPAAQQKPGKATSGAPGRGPENPEGPGPKGGPPGSRQRAKPVPSENVVAFNRAAISKAREWVKGATTKRRGAFLSTSEAWEAYVTAGGGGITRREFSRILKEALGEGAYGRRGSARGYKGIAMMPEAMQIAVSA